MRVCYLFIAITAALILALFLFSDAIAHGVWRTYHNDTAALFLTHRNATLPMQIGDYYFGKEAYNLAKAARAYEKALAIDEKTLWGHYQTARILFIKGDYERALAEINKELTANPENLRSLYIRGLIHGYRKEWQNAENDFKAFTRWSPGEWAGYNDLAWTLSAQGKHEEAKNAIKMAFAKIKDGTKNPWLWNARGVAELNLKEYKNAKHSFETALAYADALTASEWRRAYPGNNPQSAEEGLLSFRKAVEENIRRAGVEKIP